MFDVMRFPAFVGALVVFQAFCHYINFRVQRQQMDTKFYIFTFNG